MWLIDFTEADSIPEDGAFVCSLFLTGIIVWFLGKKLNADASKILVNPETGQQYKMGVRHSLFFIPLHYWGPIFLLLSIGALINLLIE